MSLKELERQVFMSWLKPAGQEKGENGKKEKHITKQGLPQPNKYLERDNLLLLTYWEGASINFKQINLSLDPSRFSSNVKLDCLSPDSLISVLLCCLR